MGLFSWDLDRETAFSPSIILRKLQMFTKPLQALRVAGPHRAPASGTFVHKCSRINEMRPAHRQTKSASDCLKQTPWFRCAPVQRRPILLDPTWFVFGHS